MKESEIQSAVNIIAIVAELKVDNVRLQKENDNLKEKLKSHNSEYVLPTAKSFDKESYMNWCVASGTPADMAEGVYERFIK